MTKGKKASKKGPTKAQGEAAQSQELSEEQLEQVAGGASKPSLTAACCNGAHITEASLVIR